MSDNSLLTSPRSASPLAEQELKGLVIRAKRKAEGARQTFLIPTKGL